MGVVAERMAAMTLNVSTPDGQITGVHRASGDVELVFAEGAYRRYRERELERQLSRLCMRLWVEYQRQYDAIFAEAIGDDPTAAVTPVKWLDSRQRRFRAEQAETVCEGMSGGGVVCLRSIGLVRWDVVIRDGTLTKIDEHEFCVELGSAYTKLMVDYRAKMNALQEKHYGT